MNNKPPVSASHSNFSSDQSVVASAIQETKSSRPKPEVVVSALVNLEKKGKKATTIVSYESLIGKWRLHLITGTKKTRQRAGVMLGAGRYLPSWLKIHLSYTENSDQALTAAEPGYVENSVSVAGLRFTLSGPTKFFPKQNLLAFDFTHLTLQILGKVIYSGNVRGGDQSKDNFYQEPIKKQAFFRYFLIEDQYIAARGRGGGLALWRRENS
ncbi:MAG: hypothetical protein GVY17_15400 [Cyanobacteria bacterium]|nr:hypothetical protein [Cyanobacteria bacterium GSL.Bin21]